MAPFKDQTFSIVMLSFNQAKFLSTAVDSVLSQRGAGVEVIVVDPGSTDGSREILESFGTTIRTIFEKDSGPADGLNRGFSIARGDLFGFLNADDVLLPEALSRVSEMFSAQENLDIISGHGYVVDERGKHLRRIYSDGFSRFLFAFGVGIFVQPSTFFKSYVYKNTGGFNVWNRSNWDGEFFIDAILAGARHKVVDDFYSLYRLHNLSITGSGRIALDIEEYQQRMFERLWGRKTDGLDRVRRLYSAGLKYWRKPDALYERLRFGRVYKRYER